MRYQINRKNIERNISVPRLPYFTEEEKMLVKGTCFDVFVLRVAHLCVPVLMYLCLG